MLTIPQIIKYEIGSIELSNFIESYYGIEYNIAAGESVNNGSFIEVDDLDKKLDKYEKEALAEFLATPYSEVLGQKLMNDFDKFMLVPILKDLFQKGEINQKEFTVNVWW